MSSRSMASSKTLDVRERDSSWTDELEVQSAIPSQEGIKAIRHAERKASSQPPTFVEAYTVVSGSKKGTVYPGGPGEFDFVLP